MAAVEKLITDHLDLWTTALKRRSGVGRGSSRKLELYGIKKLRELILELAVCGLLVPQDPKDEPASEQLKKIAAERARRINEGKAKKGKSLPKTGDGDTGLHLPAGWSWTCVAALGEIAPKNDIEDDVIASFVPMPLISTKFDGRHEQEVKRWAEVKKGYTHFADGDVAIAKITPCFENSKAAIFYGLQNGVGAGTTELHVVRPFGEFISRSYLLLYLKSPQFLRVGESKMTGSAGQKRVPSDFFAFNPLPLPPLAEQHRIVAKVDALMALCDKLEQQTDTGLNAHQTLVETLLNTLIDAADHSQFACAWQRIAKHFDILFTTGESLDQLKQTILQLAVTGKLVAQDPNDVPAKELVTLMAVEKERLEETEGLRTSASVNLRSEDQYFSTPKTWAWVRLGNLAKFIDYRGKTPEKIEAGVRLITAKNVRYGFIDINPEEFISSEDYDAWMTRGFPREGDTLFTTEAPLGNAANITLREKFALAQRTICFQWHEPKIGPYMLLQILAKPFQDRLTDHATGMTATGIKAAKLKEIPVAIPPLREQHRIVNKVDELMTLCDQLAGRLSNAQSIQFQLADALIEKALARV